MNEINLEATLYDVDEKEDLFSMRVVINLQFSSQKPTIKFPAALDVKLLEEIETSNSVKQTWDIDHRCILYLDRFPYDRQILDLRVEIENLETFEFGDVFSMNNTRYFDLYRSSLKQDLDHFEVSLFLERDPTFWVWNVVVITFLINLTAGILIAVNPYEVSDRVWIILDIMLALGLIRLQLNVPDLEYLTWLDRYLLFCLLYLFIFACEIFAVSEFLISDNNLAKKLNMILITAIESVWVLLHGIMFLLWQFNCTRGSWGNVRKRKSRKLQSCRAEFNERSRILSIGVKQE